MKIALLRTLAVAVWIVSVGALMMPTPPVSAAITVGPTLLGPEDGAVVTSLGPALTWSNPGGVTQYHLQVIPANNDGPGIDALVGKSGNQYTVPAPPSWYGMLPGMTYTWRVRVSDATASISLTDPSWSPWSERKFRTPTVTASGITASMPVTGDVVTTLTPSLQWAIDRSDIFYYELQLSKDATFNTDPTTATAMVYSSLRHGGVTAPRNSYSVPSDFPLENGLTYSWRVRPRVQGDGTPVAWSPTYSFQTNTAATPALRVEKHSFGASIAAAETCQIAGAATTFPSTVQLTGIHYAYKYSGAGATTSNWYRDDVSISTTARALVSSSTCLRATLGSPDAPDAAVPFLPGTYRNDVWYAGQKVQSASFVVTPAAVLDIGPVIIGTGITNLGNCQVSGVAATFVRATTVLWARLNTVGTGSYTMAIFSGTTQIGNAATINEGSPANCILIPLLGGTGGWQPGSYRLDVSIGTKVVQSGNYTIS